MSKIDGWASKLECVLFDGGDETIVISTKERIGAFLQDTLEEVRAEYDAMLEDARGPQQFAERLEVAASERADVTLFGVDYTALPLDADGKPIHVEETDTWECVGTSFTARRTGTFEVHVMECDACGGTFEHVNGMYEFCPRCGRRIYE